MHVVVAYLHVLPVASCCDVSVACLKNFICHIGFEIILRLVFFIFDFCARIIHLLFLFFTCVGGVKLFL